MWGSPRDSRWVGGRCFKIKELSSQLAKTGLGGGEGGGVVLSLETQPTAI